VTLDEVVEALYPVGAIYVSTLSTNPGTLFGVGTWAAFGAGKVLVGLDGTDTDFDTVEETGGAKTKAISAHAGTAVADHSAHTHSVTSNVAVGDHAAHTHSVTSNVAVGNHAALGTHAHELPWQIPSTTTIRQIAVGTFGTGTSRAATAVSAAGTANTTSAAVALSQAVSAGTPDAHSVTNNAVTSGNPSATLSHSVTNNAVTSGNPSATLTHSVTQPSDHAALNVVQPYVVVFFWKRTA